MTSLQTQRNSSFDIIKCIAAFLVVCIHYLPKSNMLDAYLNAICRVAVPLFFIISGYYYDKIKSSNRLKSYIVKIVKLTILTSLFYFIVYAIKHTLEGNLVEWLLMTFSIKNMFYWLIFNAYPISYHIWYLYALLYAILVNVFADKLRANTYLLHISLILLFLHLVLNLECHSIYLRNWLFMGFPFLSLGRYLNHYEDKIIRLSITNRKIYAIIIISLILLFVEILCLKKINVTYRDLYFSVIPCVIAIAVLAIKNHYYVSDSFVSRIGKYNSSDIYIYHMFIGSVLLSFFNMNQVPIQYFLPLTVFVVTIIFSLGLNLIKQHVSISNKNYKLTGRI